MIGDNMIYKHEYKDGKLYLYFDYRYEFGKFVINKNKSYIDTIKEYINKINYKGSKIVIMVGAVVVTTLILNGNNISIDNNIDKIVTSEIQNEEKIDYNVDNLESNIIMNDEDTNQYVDNNFYKKTDINELEHKVEETKIQEENNNVQEEILEEKKLINPINVIHNGVNIEMELEDYVVGVVAIEMPASFNIEALKAQSIIARTYALNLKNQGRALTDNESTQSYIDVDQMKSKWGSEFDKYYTKIVDAVNSTKGITIKYNGKYIDCVYHSTSNGYTEDAKNVWGNDIPYLKSVDSSWDKNAITYKRELVLDLNTFNTKLGVDISSSDDIVIERSNTNRVSNIKVGDKVFSGIEFRNILGLRSNDFDINIDNDVIITTRGYGHGVGMSQYGANLMANNGSSYIDILNHYYTNVVIS